jgi:hypothetical protein
MSIVVDRAIPEFKRKVDPTAQPVGTVYGEQGPVCRVLKSDKYRYYISYIGEFFRSFARICNDPDGGIGESINKPELMSAINTDAGKDNTWIIVVKPINYIPYKIPTFDNDVRFYGLLARDWYQYFVRNPSAENTPKGRTTPNISIPAKLLKNMEGFNTNIGP